MPIAHITYRAFVYMFRNSLDPSQDFSSYEKDGMIELEWESVKCENPAREAGGWAAFIWKPSSHYEKAYEGKWIRQEYNGSSPFGIWWSWVEDDDFDPGPDYLTDEDNHELECGCCNCLPCKKAGREHCECPTN